MKKDSKTKFIDKSNLIHNYKYCYSLVNYKTAKTKVQIICPIHGVFEQTPDSHTRNHGCQKCHGGIKIDLDDFMAKAHSIHGSLYDYTEVNYINSSTKITIKCPLHGIFKQTPNDHLTGYGCFLCGVNNRAKKRTSSTFVFIDKAINVHGELYDYSAVKYTDSSTKVKIFCHIHGIFEQTPNQHLTGHGCPSCRQSKGERQIRQFLLDNRIEFVPQKRFQDCRHIRPLPFDFYLPSLNTCIEYDGQQHYRPIQPFGGTKSFALTKLKDQIKTNYCRNNNIPLIRISYLDEPLDVLLILVNKK